MISKLVSIICLVFGCTLCAQAAVIYSNLGPGLSYDNGALIAANGSLAVATPFLTPSGANYDLTALDIAIDQSGGPNTALVALMADSSGLPGGVIASWTMNFPSLFSNFSIVASQQITGITGIALNENTTYWLAALPTSNATDTWWRGNNTGQHNVEANSNNGGASWSSLLTQNANVAFAVYGNSHPVPEPETFTMLLAGLGLLGFTTRRRKNHVT